MGASQGCVGTSPVPGVKRIRPLFDILLTGTAVGARPPRPAGLGTIKRGQRKYWKQRGGRSRGNPGYGGGDAYREHGFARALSPHSTSRTGLAARLRARRARGDMIGS